MPKLALLLVFCVLGCQGTSSDESSSVPANPIDEPVRGSRDPIFEWVGDWKVRNPYDANEYFRGTDDDGGRVTFSMDGTWSLFSTHKSKAPMLTGVYRVYENSTCMLSCADTSDKTSNGHWMIREDTLTVICEMTGEHAVLERFIDSPNDR